MIVLTPYTKGAGYFMDGKKLNVSQRKEADIQTCAHCQAIIKMQEWKEDGAWCGKEMKPICGPCGTRALNFGCEPFLKKIEERATQSMRFDKHIKEYGNMPEAQALIISGRNFF